MRRKLPTLALAVALILSLLPLLSLSGQPTVSAQELTQPSTVATLSGSPIIFTETDSCVKLNFTMFTVEFYNDYNKIYDGGGNVLVHNDRTVLECWDKNLWKLRGIPTGIEYEKVDNWHYRVTRHYDDFLGTTYDITYDVRANSPMKTTISVQSGQTDNYRIAWYLSGIVHTEWAEKGNRLIFGEGEEPHGWVGFDWEDVYQSFGEITSTIVESHAEGKKANIFFNIGIVNDGERITIDPSVVGTTEHLDATMYSYQRKTFYAAGRFWVWFSDETNFVYRSSTDGTTWTDAVSVGWCTMGYFGSVWFDDPFVHYALFGPYEMYYRRGQPLENGDINWSEYKQTVYYGTFTDYCGYPMITVDSGGYAWMGVKYSDGENEYPEVLKNANNDGTWSTAADFPYQLSAISDWAWRVSVIPLTGGKVYAIYSRGGVAGYGKLWDGEAWGDEETAIADVEYGQGHSAVAQGDDIHLVYLNDDLAKGIMYNKRTYGSGWGTETTVQANADTDMFPALSINPTDNKLYCFFSTRTNDKPFTGAIANHIYYRVYDGESWGDPVDWIDESTDGLKCNYLLTSSYQVKNNKICLLYMTKKESPYNVKFDFLSLVPPGVAPDAPTNLQPSARQTTTSVTISCLVTDNDSAKINAFFYDNSTKNLIENIWVDNNTTASVVWSGLTRGNTYTFFARGKDNTGLWGENSDTQSFIVNSLPTVTNLKTEGATNPTRLTTFTPTFSWTYSDAEGDDQSHYLIWVGTTDGGHQMWEPEWVVTDNKNAVYGGSELSRGILYYVRVRTKDGYEESDWVTGKFTINQLPTQTVSAQTFYDDYTPTLVWGFSDPDSGDTQKGVKIRVGTTSGNNDMWDHSDTTTTEHLMVYGGEALEKNVTYYLQVQVSDSCEWSGTWSENTFEILPLTTLVVAEITVDNTPVDRKAHWVGNDDVRIYVTAKDDEGRDAIENCYFWIRDNNDAVVVDNVIHTGYENGDDENTKLFWYDYNPSDILLDSALGEFDVKVQVVSATAEDTEDYTELGFKLFTVDDHAITFAPVREIYAEGEIITFEPTVKSVASGLSIDNAYLKLELISELGEVLRTVSGYTNGSGKLATHTTLLEADIGFYDVRISTSKGAIDGQKLYEDVFSVVAELPVGVESVTPSDDYVSGLLRSRSIVVEDVVVKVFVYDASGMELLSLTSDTIRVENTPPQLKNWSVPYEKEGQTLTLAEGTYSYRVEVWTADLGTMYHVYFAEVRLSVAPSQQPVGDWVSVDTYEVKDGTFDVVLYRESIVTNPETVDKSNFMFRESIPAPQGSTVMVKVSGLPPQTLTVDQFGTITKYFDVPHSETIRVEMEVTIASAVKIEKMGAEEVIVASAPRTAVEHEFKVTNLTATTLRQLELTFPVSGVTSVMDEEGKPVEKFWETKSTTVEIAILEPYGEITLTLTAEAVPSINKIIDMLISWTIWGIPMVVLTFGMGVLLWIMTKHRAGAISQVGILILPTVLVVAGIWLGIL